MSTPLVQLVAHLDNVLQPDQFKDYCPNGLQVQGAAEVLKVATGVTASQALLDAALDWGADAVLVHHGYFWRGEDPCIVGMKRRRLATLLAADVSLLAYHLPLDAHPEFGNNATLGKLLGIHPQAQQPLPLAEVGNVADLEDPVGAADLVTRLEQITGRSALHIGDEARPLRRIAWCTGAAQGYIDAALAAGADAFVTGEVSEQTVHIAREEGINFIAAGHHATERYGVQALGEHLVEQFSLDHRFFDIDNPV